VDLFGDTNMIRVLLEIDNKAAHSCSPLIFLTKFILQEAFLQGHHGTDVIINTPYAKIKVTNIEQE